MERRRHQRTARGAGEHEISIASVSGDWRVPAELVSLTSGGAQLKISAEHALPAAVSRSLMVWLCDKGSGISLPIEARLVHRREEAGQRVLGVNFLDQRTLGGLLHPLLGPIFNRRASLRVAPSKREGRVPVLLSAPPELGLPQEEGSLVDISTGGLAIDLSTRFEEGLSGHDSVGISCRLPATGERFSAPVRIVHRTLKGDLIRCGCQFLETEAPSFKHVHEAVLGYVIRRQREMVEEHELMSGEGIPLGALSRAGR